MAMRLVPPTDDFGPTDYEGMPGPKRPRKPPEPPRIPIGKRSIILHVARGNQPEHGGIQDEMCRALGENAAVFRRDGRMVHVIDGDAGRAIRPLTQGSLRSYAHKRAVFLEEDDHGRPLEVAPPLTLARELLELGTYPGVRYLAGLTTAPMLRPDGSVLQTPGYDEATGYLYEPSESFPAVPDYPSPSDAAKALGELREPFAEMAYVSEPARFVPVALALTLLARPAIVGPTPMFCIDATAAGSGKTLSLTVATTIALGAPAPATTWHDNRDEREKQLAGLALGAARVNLWDNVSTRIGGDDLEAALTATRRASRRLGESGQIDTPWHTVLCCSGNQLRIASDMRRRCLIGRIEPDVEDPSAVTGFAIEHLDSWTRQHRARLVVAALTVLRFSAVAKAVHEPRANWGSYEAWCDVVRNAILGAGGPDILAARAPLDADENSFADARLLELLEPVGVFTARTLHGKLSGLHKDERSTEDAELRDLIIERVPLKERLQGLPSARRIGYVLRAIVKKWAGNRRLNSYLDRNSVTMWHIEGRQAAGDAAGDPENHHPQTKVNDY